jgi:hypothetical protein
MALNNGEVLYGLRNLATGDGEEERIQGVTSKVSQKVLDLVDRGAYVLAYRVAIRESGIKMTREECYEWAKWWIDDDGDPDQLADEMFEQYLSINQPDGQSLSHHVIDGIEYLFIVDEGFADGWREQIDKRWTDAYHGPFYIYPTNDPVLTLISNAPMTQDQRWAVEHPEDSKM